MAGRVDESESIEALRMSLGEHLEDLRGRILLGLAGPLVVAIVLLFFGRQLVAIIAQPLLFEFHARGLHPTLLNTQVPGGFGVYMKIALIGGLTLGIPWLMYQLWLFIAPGLYARERRFVIYLAPFSGLLAITGLAFMYFIMLPVTLSFLISFSLSYPMPDLTGSPVQRQLAQLRDDPTPPDVAYDPAPVKIALLEADPPAPAEGDLWFNVPQNTLKLFVGGQIVQMTAARPSSMISPWFSIEDYISFVLWLALAFAVSFQLPLVMLMLGWTGLVDLGTFRRGRRYALLIILVSSAMLTPPDVASQVLLSLPVYGLYELGLVLMKMFIKPHPPLRFEDEGV